MSGRGAQKYFRLKPWESCWQKAWEILGWVGTVTHYKHVSLFKETHGVLLLLEFPAQIKQPGLTRDAFIHSSRELMN